MNSKKLANIQVMYNNRKIDGYVADQLPTTHSISFRVHDTEQANGIFDAITYNKGGATLRQLMALLGEDRFSRGLQSYFRALEFKNSTLDDFIAHLQKQFEEVKDAGFTLQEWK